MEIMEKLFILPRRSRNAPNNKIHLGNSLAPLRRTIFLQHVFQKGIEMGVGMGQGIRMEMGLGLGVVGLG